ncbi:hypothetical protein D0T12_05350 [Actinomadura spongiicola]|uniref:Uncharacterized protein n=1 Tax=Actinomadura spongiicola TaxID=2303421 RepID=A0A372GL08_9ACTN|nr:hypothetical protein [Actinomadura spongiicola]RFS86058.1 hypothetical protein D0T12_05350 [Actinomadura spongiicola]
MNVLFMALGASRRPAVLRESAQVAADGGHSVVLVQKASAWAKESLPDGVDMVELAELERRYGPAAPRFLLYRIPRLLLRVCLPGPLRGARDRVYAGYRRRVARPIERRLVRLLRREPAAVRARAVDRELLRGRSIDLVVVADPQSFVTAAELADLVAGAGARLAYSIAPERTPTSNARGE